MKDYVVNLKNPEDSPEKIATKINTLVHAIDAQAIRGVVTREEHDSLLKLVRNYINGNKERLEINMNDMRWHGAGLTRVTHDATLTGEGTAASPLSAVGSGSGTVTSVNASGGTTGLSFTGGPVTTSGTLTLGGTLGVANGGTGTTTAFTTGSVIFAGSSGVYAQDNANLFYNDSSNQLYVGTNTALYGVYGKIQLAGTGASSDSPILLIKNTTDDSLGKNAGIWTQTRMTSHYLFATQNIGQNDNSFSSPGVIQWTAFEYTDSSYSNLVAATEFTGWSYQYFGSSGYINLLRVHTAGVGIGMTTPTTVPATLFQVNDRSVAAGTAGVDDLVTISRPINSGVSYQQVAVFAVGTYSTNGAGNGFGPDTRLDLKLKSTSSDNFTADLTVMTWLDNGNVGIGNTLPLAALDIDGTQAAPATSGSAANGIIRMGDVATTNAVLDMGTISSTSASWIQARNKTNYATNYNIGINPNGGSVGVGTTAPDALFKVKSVSNTGNLMSIENTAGAVAFVLDNNQLYAQFYNGGGINNPSLGFNKGVGISVSGITATSDLGLCVGNSAKVIINTSGNVGIGAASPSVARLHIISTTNQVRTGYDTSNYFDITVSSAGAVTFDATGASAGFTFNDLVALGANSLTMTGSLATTGSRVTKGWFTDIESTNMPTVGGTSLSSTFSTIASPTFTGIPAAPTAGAGTSTTQLATTAFVQQEKVGYVASMICGVIASPADTTSYYFVEPTLTQTTDTSVKWVIPKAGTIKSASVNVIVVGTLSSGEDSTIAIRLNATTDINISTIVETNATSQTYSVSGLSQAVAVGDFISIKFATPTWVTNPTSVKISASVYIE